MSAFFRITTGIIVLVAGCLTLITSFIDYEAIDPSTAKNIQKWNERHHISLKMIGIGLIGDGLFYMISRDDLYSQVMLLVFAFMIISGYLSSFYNNMDHFHQPFINNLIKRKK